MKLSTVFATILFPSFIAIAQPDEAFQLPLKKASEFTKQLINKQGSTSFIKNYKQPLSQTVLDEALVYAANYGFSHTIDSLIEHGASDRAKALEEAALGLQKNSIEHLLKKNNPDNNALENVLKIVSKQKEYCEQIIERLEQEIAYKKKYLPILERNPISINKKDKDCDSEGSADTQSHVKSSDTEIYDKYINVTHVPVKDILKKAITKLEHSLHWYKQKVKDAEAIEKLL